MGQPCGKCGSRSTYVNEVWSAAGRSNELSCMMCGWRGGGLNRGKVIQMAKGEKHSKLVRRGTCENCGRQDVTMITSKFCSGCYPHRNDPKAMEAAALRLGRVTKRIEKAPWSSSIVIDKDSPVVINISFCSSDAALYESLIVNAARNRRTPEDHVLFLLQQDGEKRP